MVSGAQESIGLATEEIATLRKNLSRRKAKQIRSDDERQLVKATAHAWFNSHRRLIIPALGEQALQEVDEGYRTLLASAARATSRPKCLKVLKHTKNLLSRIEAEHAVELADLPLNSYGSTNNVPPDFSALVSDLKMQAILKNRWQECVKCVEGGAPLASVVMMGGVLEGLLLARVNQLNDKAPVFKANSAPRDKKGNTRKLNEWGLRNYIDVAHELGWITKTTKDVGEVVRDYRNYIHPQKEYSHGISLSPDDAKMLWEVAKSVARQVVKT